MHLISGMLGDSPPINRITPLRFIISAMLFSIVISSVSGTVLQSTEYYSDLLIRLGETADLGDKFSIQKVPIFYPKLWSEERPQGKVNLDLSVVEARNLPYSNATQYILKGKTSVLVHGSIIDIKTRIIATPLNDLLNGYISAKIRSSNESSMENYLEPRWMALKAGPSGAYEAKRNLLLTVYTWQTTNTGNDEHHLHEHSEFVDGQDDEDDEESYSFGRRSPLMQFPESNWRTSQVRIFGKTRMPACRVAVIAGYDVARQYGSSLGSYIEGIVMDSSAYYQKLLGVRFEIAAIVAITDPRHRLARDSSNILNDMSSAIYNGELTTNRGQRAFKASDYCYVHHIRGNRPRKDAASRVNGRGLVGGICRGNFIQNIGYSSLGNRPRREIVRTFMHEAGHAFGAFHDPQQCYSPKSAFLMSTTGNPDSPNFMVFSTCSLNAILRKMKSQMSRSCFTDGSGAYTSIDDSNRAPVDIDVDVDNDDDENGGRPTYYANYPRPVRLQYGNSGERTSNGCSRGTPVGSQRQIIRRSDGSIVKRTTTFCRVTLA